MAWMRILQNPKVKKFSLPASMLTLTGMQLRWRIAQFFEIRWWQHYLAGKEKKAYLDWKKNYWQTLLRRLEISIPAGARVLDAGCGPAGIFTVLGEQKVDALDPLLERYERDLPHFRRSEYPAVCFYCETLEGFRPEQAYDLVFCLNAINHVADLGACFEQLGACTRPGGRLVLTVDAHHYGFLKRIFRLVPGDILHPHQYDLEEYESMLTQQGFQVERKILLKKERIFGYYALVAVHA
jgi:2-polyprenyl-6-hydroxyphenyl methylase/3-demethylubiquinone-9 3-methyltransferase